MSATLNAAIERQLTTRTKRNAEGKLLCRRCEKVVPDEYSIVFWDPSDETKVWGPCCSDECICHLKICSECNQDFVIDKGGEITHVGDGVWLCKHCITKVEICQRCHRKGTLHDTPQGKMCKGCMDKVFFTCKDCKELLPREQSMAIVFDVTQQAQWSHVLKGEERALCKKCFGVRSKNKSPLSVGVCGYCANVFPLHAESHKFCQSCITNHNVRKCGRCEEYVTRWENYGNKSYCRSCYPKLIFCACCKDQGFFPKEGIKYKGKSRTYLVCPSCSSKKKMAECPSCMTLAKDGVLLDIKGKKPVCNYCKNKYNFCGNCNEFHFNEPDCRSHRTKVCDYSYKPFPYFNGALNDRVFFGFENEINYTEENYDCARDTVLRGYPSTTVFAKRDGSISGQGFELVSHPMSLEFFNNLDLEPMFRVKPRERDTSCGLHVHISRTSFDGQAHLFKLTQFINDNKTFTKKVAGRDFNSYAYEYRDKISKAVKGTGQRERYHAVNLTNKNTVEIRIFKSARNEFQLRYRIEFVNAVIEYTRSTSLQKLSADDFKAWLKASVGYTNLKKFLKLIPSTDA